MPVDKVLSKLTATDSTDYFLLTSLHDNGESGFDLALVCDDRAWTGTLPDTQLERASDKLKMKYEDYVTQTRKAFTRQNIGALQFQYAMKLNAKSITLTWKKHIAKDNIKIQLGSLELKEKESPSDVISVIFEHALQATTNLQSHITALQADKERLMSERASALKRLEKCVAAKEDMERSMYEKFAVVVNDKKAKIRSLKEQLDGTSTGGASVSQSSGAGEGTSGHKRVIKDEDTASETDELSLHDSEYETDEEKVRPPAKKARPAAASKPALLSDEDSLLLDDGSGPATPVGPRRRRKPDTSKKQTPSRPVIPKGTSRDSTPRQGSRRGSLRKNSSNSSNRSNQSQDIDNLYDEM